MYTKTLLEKTAAVLSGSELGKQMKKLREEEFKTDLSGGVKKLRAEGKEHLIKAKDNSGVVFNRQTPMQRSFA